MNLNAIFQSEPRWSLTIIRIPEGLVLAGHGWIKFNWFGGALLVIGFTRTYCSRAPVDSQLIERWCPDYGIASKYQGQARLNDIHMQDY